MMINQQDRVEFTPALEASLRGIADEAAQRLGISSSSELSLLLVDNEYIKELNFMYRGKDEATDVLSFAMNELGEEEPELEELDDINMLGDIVISVEQAWHQSQEYGHSLERELGYLLVHGLLHLLGYDHESEREQKLMREWEEKIMSAVGLSR
ncbi:MAG: rRNA maturation RNase YbeY [Syntrophomonadaceae bacterium]|jgi:probable rRNA maturation factor|nr:rRNA maturation RNase YbeY [Syntrophomonadaceae bacterium]